jgi:hypothetical protein
MNLLLGILAAYGLIYGTICIFTEDEKEFGLCTLILTLLAIILAVLYTGGLL